MRLKRLILTSFILLGFGLTEVHAQTIHIKHKAESQNQYNLENIRKLIFSSGNITVMKTGGSSEIFALNDLRYINFSDINTSIKFPQVVKTASLNLFPNPAGSGFYLKATDGKTINGTIEVISMAGRCVKTQSVSGNSEIFIDISDIEKGIYLCRYRNAKEMQIMKIAKQ